MFNGLLPPEDYEFDLQDWVTCPVCGWIYDLNPTTPCPGCSTHPKQAEVYPQGAEMKLIKMIQHYYYRSISEVFVRRQKLIDHATHFLGSHCDINVLVSTAHHVRQTYNEFDPDDDEPRRQAIAEALGVPPEQVSNDLCELIMDHHEHTYEQKVIVLMGCTLLETLLYHLLYRLLILAGDDPIAAEQAVDKERGFDRRTALFKSRTGRSLKDALQTGTFRHFYDEWKQLRDVRNLFLHKDPLAIGEPDAQRAVGLARDAIPAFAGVHNLVCIH